MTHRVRCVCLLLATGFVGACSKPEPRVLDYLLQVKPGMTVTEVKALFPASMLTSDSAVDQAKHSTLMDRRFREVPPVRVLLYINHGTYDGDAAYLYFDADDKLMGVDHSASSGRQLQDEDLKFNVPGAP